MAKITVDDLIKDLDPAHFQLLQIDLMLSLVSQTKALRIVATDILNILQQSAPRDETFQTRFLENIERSNLVAKEEYVNYLLELIEKYGKK